MLTASFVPWKTPPDVVPIEVLVLGGTMLVLIVLLHGAGLDRIVTLYKKRADVMRTRKRHPHFATYIFAGTILLILMLHITEACIWGIVLNKVGLIENLRDSIYFSANTYTTIGYGQMILPFAWRELSPIMAISGLFTFAWTTGEIFNIAQHQHQMVADLSDHRKNTQRSKQKSFSPEAAPKQDDQR
jgi:hypothetical protein